jgi:hypothetical protein
MHKHHACCWQRSHSSMRMRRQCPYVVSGGMQCVAVGQTNGVHCCWHEAQCYCQLLHTAVLLLLGRRMGHSTHAAAAASRSSALHAALWLAQPEAGLAARQNCEVDSAAECSGGHSGC